MIEFLKSIDDDVCDMLRRATPNQQLWLMGKLFLNLKSNGLKMISMPLIVIIRP